MRGVTFYPYLKELLALNFSIRKTCQLNVETEAVIMSRIANIVSASRLKPMGAPFCVCVSLLLSYYCALRQDASWGLVSPH